MRLYKAGVRLGMRVGVRRAGHLARLRIDVPVPLRSSGNAICPRNAGVEPLRRVRRSHLAQNHVGDFIVKCLRVFLRDRSSHGLRPRRASIRQAVRDLLDRAFRPGNHLALFIAKRCAEGVDLRDARTAEIFLRENIGRHLRPVLRDLDVLHVEDGLAIGISEHAARASCIEIARRELVPAV